MEIIHCDRLVSASSRTDASARWSKIRDPKAKGQGESVTRRSAQLTGRRLYEEPPEGAEKTG